ncbi:hypothetical protein FO519_005317 [Halicephalobus sp. NKZ332]|nr:hypothetical protein FO519_005317 [Halicephalobus sp. NKZ332]
MFKGLKNKLEDEAKRLSATASQYAANVASQVRSGASDAGSDISGYTKKILNSVQNETTPGNVPNLMKEENLISLDDDVGDSTANTSALLEGFDEPPERVRRLSDASIESNESSLSALFGSALNSSAVPKLETISSDVESMSDGGWDAPETATKDQLKSVLDNIRGRAVNYKDKYHDLVKRYNDSVRENEKLKLVLTKTQDKTLKRIEKLRDENRKLQLSLNSDEKEEKIKKLQELLERCRDTITTQKSKITTLTTENKEMKETLEANGDIEKINSEWKGRIDRVNEEFSKRLTETEEKSSIAIASAKAESHELMQQKDQEIEKWINKCHTLEKESDASQKYEQQISQLHKTISALEVEKKDMIDKLSQAKQEGVKLVMEEEAKKLEKMKSEYEERIQDLETKIENAKDEATGNSQKELDSKNEEIENFKTALSNLESEKAAAESKVIELNGRIGEMEARHKTLNDLHKESDEKTADVMGQLEELLTKISGLEEAIKKKDEEMELLQEKMRLEKEEAVSKLNAELAEKEEKGNEQASNVSVEEYSKRLGDYYRAVNLQYSPEPAATLDDLIDNAGQMFTKYYEELKQKLVEADNRTDDVSNQQDEKLEQLAREVSQLQGKNEELEKQIGVLNEEREENSRLLDELKNALKVANEHAEAVIEEKEKALRNIADIEDQLTPITSSGAVIDRIRELMNKLRENEGQSSDSELLQQSLEAVQKEKDEIEKQSEETMAQIRSALSLEESENLLEKVAELAESVEKLEEIEASLQSYTKINEKIAHQNAGLMAAIEQICSSLQYTGDESGLVDRVEALVQELGSKDSELEQISANYNNLKEQLEFLERELTVHKNSSSQVDELQSQINLLKEDIQYKDSKVIELAKGETKLNEIMSILSSFNEKENIFSLVNDVARALSDRDGELCAASSNLATRLANEHHDRVESNQNASEMEVQMNAANKEKLEAEKLYSELQKSHEDLRVQYIQKEKFVEELHVELRKLEAELTDEKERSSALADEFEEKRANYESALLAKNAELQKLQNLVDSTNGDKTKLQGEISTLTNTETQLRTELTEITKEKDISDKKIEELEKSIQSIKIELEEANSNIMDKDAEIVMLSDRVNEAHESLTALSEDRRKEELTTENNTRKVKTLERELREVCETLEKKNAEATRTDQKIKELEERLQEALEKEKNGEEFVDDSGFDAMIDQEELAALRVQTAAFAEPTEAEYLRNVLYRYMVERETLGKEIVVSFYMSIIPLKRRVSDFGKSDMQSAQILAFRILYSLAERGG